MKSLILNTSDSKGGAAKAIYRLHAGLRSLGVDSRMIVMRKFGDDPNVMAPDANMSKGLALLRPILDSFPLRRYQERNDHLFSPSWVPDFLSRNVARNAPDVVHLSWVNLGFLRIESLKSFHKPLLWTLHDSWAFTGGCHIPLGCFRYRDFCGQCPALGSKGEHDLSRTIWKRKSKAWKDLNLHIISPSRWLANCAKSSSLFQDIPISVIPNGIDTSRFKPIEQRVAREILALPQGKNIILFGAFNSTIDKIKGFDVLLAALERLRAEQQRDNELELIVFGASHSGTTSDRGLNIRYLGYLHDDISLALLYAAADVFVLPSLQENLPNTIMEAMACGTPSVAFDVGGISDLIAHKITGYLARPLEVEDLANGIEWVLADERRRQTLSKEARKKVEREFDMNHVAKRYLDLYTEVLQKKK